MLKVSIKCYQIYTGDPKAIISIEANKVTPKELESLNKNFQREIEDYVTNFVLADAKLQSDELKQSLVRN